MIKLKTFTLAMIMIFTLAACASPVDVTDNGGETHTVTHESDTLNFLWFRNGYIDNYIRGVTPEESRLETRPLRQTHGFQAL
jgi:hypothetical protein